MKGKQESLRMRKARRRRRKLILKLLSALLAVVVMIAVCIQLFAKPKVIKELTLEAGSSRPELTDFTSKDCKDARVVSGLDDTLNMNTVADYNIVIEVSGKEYTSVLHVVDTTEPVVTAQKTWAYTTGTMEPKDLITEILDATATTAAFVKKPDFSRQGIQKIEIIVTDEGGNAVTVEVEVEVVEDMEPPVIQGVQELSVPAGNSVSYKKGITIMDNYDKNVGLTIDNSQVNLNKEGDYPITYIATDKAGNVAEISTILHVDMATVEQATESLVNAKADELLEEITNEDMSQYEVAEAIFFWVHDKITYSDGTPKTDWVQGAYRGLFEQKGDCFVYAATAKCLLTQAGITNMDIAKIPAKTNHYWNLIDLGDGWYHFDATRRKDGKYFFYTSDEEILAYSNTHDGTHNYDPDEYPDIQ